MNEHWTSTYISNIDHKFIEEADKYVPIKPRHSYFRSVLINFSVIAIGVAIALVIALVYPPREYKLVKEDDTYYMYIDKKYVREDFLSITIYPAQDYYSIPFASLDEMLSALHHGTFTVQDFTMRILRVRSSSLTLNICMTLSFRIIYRIMMSSSRLMNTCSARMTMIPE